VELALSPADPLVHEVLVAALTACGIDAADGAATPRSAWSAAALADGVARDPREDDGYALSPRNTRGATRT
jgi:hypothetical protein